jgi:3-oxoadipate enol-lactonase
MPFARVNDITLHFNDRGTRSAPVVVLANSLGTDSRIWDDVAGELLASHRVITYDKRGHGLSDAPDAEYKLSDHVHDLLGLLDHLDVRQFVLGGVSVGGLICQGFAVSYPRRLKGLILCNTAAKIGDEYFWNDRIAAVRQGGMSAVADAVLARWFTAQFQNEQPQTMQGWRNLVLRTPAAGYIGTCATLRDADLRADVGHIEVPTLVLVGSQDLATPPDLVRSTAEAIPGARFEIIESSGHIPMIDHPVAVSRLMQSFFHEVGHV